MCGYWGYFSNKFYMRSFFLYSYLIWILLVGIWTLNLDLWTCSLNVDIRKYWRWQLFFFLFFLRNLRLKRT